MIDQRDGKGRFRPGHAGGPGRPARPREERYLKALTGRLTQERWVAIIDRAIQDAMAGNAVARAWLSKYALPSQALAGHTLEAEHVTYITHDPDWYGNAALIEQRIADRQ